MESRSQKFVRLIAQTSDRKQWPITFGRAWLRIHGSAYLSDLAHFESWGGRIPAAPETIAEYLVVHADALSVATLNRRLAALSKVHRSRGFSNPTSVEVVKATLRGLKRIKGTAQRQATPLIKENLFVVLEATGSRFKDVRDRALLLLGRRLSAIRVDRPKLR
jgi:hypothetical protein